MAAPPDGEPTEPATLVLRVEGPAAIEIQHHVRTCILERVNRFFGWQAVGRHRAAAGAAAPPAEPPARPAGRSATAAERVAATLTAVDDDEPATGAGAARRGGQAA